MNKNIFQIITTILLAVAGLVHLYTISQGITNSLHDFHEYRQTQTAITAFYFLKEGAKINYITPILGYPFQLIMEFPLYQYLVTLPVQFGGASLELSGRLVSILFFYAFLPVYYQSLRLLGIPTIAAMLSMVFILVSPVYLYWTRTFMIESTALFFSALYVLAILQIINQKKSSIAIIWTTVAVLSGVAAALQKVTTFVPTGFAVGIYYLYATGPNHAKGLNAIKAWFKLPQLAQMFCVFVVPLIALVGWTHFADAAKMQNPLAQKWISTNLRHWNYGTWDQKTSLAIWAKILENTYLFGKINTTIVLGVLLLSVVWDRISKKWLYIALLFAGLFFLFPLFFTNLHQEHPYYCYGNCYLLLTALALLLYNLFRHSQILGVVSMLLAVVISVVMINRYRFYLAHFVQEKTNPYKAYTQFIQKQVPANNLLLVYNNAMNSNLVYYAERKALSLSYVKQINHPLFKTIMQNQQDYRFGALVVSKMDGPVDTSFVNDLINQYGFEKKPSFVNSIDSVLVFLKK